MAGNTFEEVLRIVLETQGQEGLDALRGAMSKVGDVSDETVADTGKLIDKLNDLNSAAGKAARFGQLSEDMAATATAMGNAQNATYQLTLRMGELSTRGEALAADHKAARAEVERLGAAMKQEGADTEALGKAHKAAQADVKRLGSELRDNAKEIKATSAAQQASRVEMEKLEGVYGKQADALDKLDKELSDSGRNTKDLGKLQGTLAAEIADATGDIQKQAAAMQAEAKAAAALRQRLDEGDDAFRKFAQAGNASAEALHRYRAGADAAAGSSGKLEASGGRLSKVFGGMRGLLAPVLAYLSFDAAKRGVQELANVGAAAENARRSLQNLYGGVEAGNAAYAGLRDMAVKNGVAFNDLVETAKKLKAFGLDPLNGSLQALIDQNAAVGGSMQDLDGKVLALGQAWAKQKLQGEEILQLVERGVPVWELLQKATGKNVDELQKLSSAGKLGRDVIAALYQELGKANSGAAERGLSSLSGLMAQVSARWEEFKLKIADAGVTEYFKKQLDSLLGATGNMDALAKRVADGVIGMLEALRKLGTQLAPIGAAIGNLTLFLARHAEAVANVIKAWALFRAVEIAAGFGKITQSIIATTTALVAQNTAMAATARSGAAVGGLSGLYAALTGRITAAAGAAVQLVRVLGIPAAITAGVVMLAKAYEGVVEARAKLWQSEAGLRSQQQDQLKLGQQLQQLYRDSANVAVQSGAAVSQMTRVQAQDYQFALQQAQAYYRGVINEAVATGDKLKLDGAKERMDQLGAAINDVRTHLEALTKSAGSSALKAFADEAVSKFDEIVTKSKDVKKAVSGIFDGIDLRTSDGIQQASSILEQMSARGKDAASSIKNELSAALSKVAAEDLPQLKAQAAAAMAAGVAGAKQFSDAIASVNLQRLGVDIEAIKTGFTAAGRSAIDTFKGAADEVGKLGLTVEQRSRAIAQAFDAAFKQASTKAELAALKAALQDALSAGNIGFAEFQQRIDEADSKLESVGRTGESLGARVSSGAAQASSALTSLGSSAGQAAAGVSKAAGGMEGANKSAEKGQGILAGYALKFDGMNAAAARALVSLNKYISRGTTTFAGDLFYKKMVEGLTHEMQEQQKILQKLIEDTERQGDEYDENAKRMAELRKQYKWMADSELQRLIDAEDRLRDGRERAAEAAKQEAEKAAEALKAQREAAEAAANAVAGLTGRSGATSAGAQVTAAAAEQLISSAVSATQAMSKVASSAEITLHIVPVSNGGITFNLTQTQMRDIANTVVRMLQHSKSIST